MGEEAVVKAGQRPPEGLGLDYGVAECAPTKMAQEPRQGLVEAFRVS